MNCSINSSGAFSYKGTLWQWDSGIFLRINIDIPEDEYVHFQDFPTGEVYSLSVQGSLVQIPNEILQNSGSFAAYAYTTNGNNSKTLARQSFTISARPKPPEYVYIPTPTIITYPELEELVSDMRELEARWTNPSAEVHASGGAEVDVTLTDNGVHFVFGLPGVVNYTHEQTTASAEWNINHNLHKFPSVTIVDSGNSQVMGDVEYPDNDNVIIRFSGAFSGKAFLN